MDHINLGLLLGGLLSVSEALPFFKGVKANGILHGVFNFLQSLVKPNA